MSIEIHPLKFGVVVMKNMTDINPELTNKLRERRYLRSQEALSAFTYRPILQIRMKSNGQENPQNMRAVVRFDYEKDGLNVWQQVQPQIFETEAMFYPDIVMNLAPFRTEERMTGVWEITSHIAFIMAQTLEAVSNQEKIRFLTRLKYDTVASFQWEVVQGIDSRLSPTGELVNSRAQPRNLRDVQVSVNDI